MREDRYIQAYFTQKISRESVPANPWRTANQALVPEKPVSRWQEETRTSWASMIGYAVCTLILVGLLGVQGLGLHHDVVATGWGEWLTVHPIDTEVAAFLNRCRALL